jgi:hypothetical protein
MLPCTSTAQPERSTPHDLESPGTLPNNLTVAKGLPATSFGGGHHRNDHPG